MRIRITLILLTVLYLDVRSQEQAVISQEQDSVARYPAEPLKKRFWRASGELLLTELLPWSYNRFVRKAEFAKIDFKSIGHNLKPSSWEWDDNNFKTNQFAHPYHGNLYFNSFRTNGYSFWQSVPAAFAGSFLWEIAGETHEPAPNDFINTSFGGISLGEFTFRLSNKVINERSRGFKRQAQEVLGLVINPLNGLNRLIDGKWGKFRANDGDSSFHLSGVLDVGARRFDLRRGNTSGRGANELFFRLKLNYGEKYEVSSTPFAHFSALIEAGAGDSSYLNTVQVTGALKTWKMKEDERRLHMYSLTLNYDYYKNSAFEYGGQSVNFKLISDWIKNKDIKLLTEIGSGVIVLGAVPNNYITFGEGRNYDYGPGIRMAGSALLRYRNLFEAAFSYQGGRFQTVNGSKSSYLLNTLALDFRAMLPKQFSLTLGFGHFGLNGYFKDFVNVSDVYPFVRFALGYNLIR